MHSWTVFFGISNPNARSYCMFIGMAAASWQSKGASKRSCSAHQKCDGKQCKQLEVTIWENHKI
ncbi:hypothetical protein [Sphaerochaeta sp.]|uniref:hypothetical protein n=1 Tax=Sphaerochaeta sp. TaxID=1972642 RepID=UPI003D139B5E